MKWSFSGATTFLLCPRRWAFGILAHHTAKDALRHEAHILRQLTTPWGWLGKLAHTAIIHRVIPEIRDRGSFQADAVIAETLALAERQEAFSRARRYRTDSKSQSNGDFLALDPHENGEDLTPAERELVRGRLKIAIETMAKLEEVTALIRRSRVCWPEQRVIWRLDGVVVEGTPDLLLIDDTGRLVLLDWKIREDGAPAAALQLEVYGVILIGSEQVGKFRPEFVRLLEVNLLRGDMADHRTGAERFDQADDFIFRTLEGMRRTLGGRPIGEIDPWAIETTRHPGACARCRFRSICGRGKHERGNIQPRLL